MNTKQLFGPAALIGVCLIGTTPATAAAISFSEATDPITVTTDISGAAITTSSESASLSLGTVGTPSPSTLIFRRQLTNQGTGTMEGGGGGISDILQLDSFVSGGATVGFLATFRSDPETVPEMGLPPLGNFPNTTANGNFSRMEFTASNYPADLGHVARARAGHFVGERPIRCERIRGCTGCRTVSRDWSWLPCCSGNRRFIVCCQALGTQQEASLAWDRYPTHSMMRSNRHSPIPASRGHNRPFCTA